MFQNIQGRFVPPKVSNKPTQPQQQQQSSSKEGSKENTILNGPRYQKEMGAQGHLSGPADSMPQGRSPNSTYTYIMNWVDHHGLPQSPIRTWRDVKIIIITNICPKITRIYWNAMEPPMDPLKQPGKAGKGPGPTKGKSKALEPHPGTSSGTGSTAQPAGSSKTQ